MEDKLIFRIGFDLEAAVKKAQGDADRLLRGLQTAINSKPLAVNLKIDKAGAGSIDEISSRMQELVKQWNALTEAERVASNTSGEYTGKAKEILDEYARLIGATESYARGLQQIASAAQRATAEQIRFAEQMREAEIRRYNEASRAKLKEQEEDDKRYQKWLANKEKEVQKEQEAALKKQQIQERINEQNTKAANRSVRNDEAVYYTNKALRAQEDIISNLTSKLQIYNQRIQGQQVGTEAWNKTALEIRRITEELQKANQQMQDFQQKAFQGFSDSLTKGKVDALTRYREQLRQIEADFNRLNQTGGAYNANGGLTTAANDILRQRQAIIKQINQTLTTAADAQAQREKEINRIIEQRKAKADAIAAKRKAEQAAIQSNIAKMKEERRILNQQESSIANITAKLQIQQQRLQSAKLGSGQFDKIAKEVERLTRKLEAAQKRVDELTGKTKSGADTQSSAINKTTNAFRNQETYVSRLIKRLAVYAGFQQISSFLTNIKQVTAEFELQRVSLGAIIQDQQRANQLFSEIKSFAVQSPVKILDLTKTAKQLAAYSIETDKLFETTKRLTDVSVGLGTDISRLVLAYGETKATNVMNAKELRQFAMMGIPMLELLSKKLSEIKGKTISTVETFGMIKKRLVHFDVVEDVFKDLTSEGGMFYEMQIKQGNTLYGMWAKLGDAISIMYDQIGNTESVNSGMRGMIDLLGDIVRNWRAAKDTVVAVGVAIGSLAGAVKLMAFIKSGPTVLQAAQVRVAKATITATAAQNAYNRALATGNKEQITLAKATLNRAVAEEKAAVKAAKNATLLRRATLGIGKAIGSMLGIGIVMWLVELTYNFFKAQRAANTLNNELKKIKAQGESDANASISNFISLANAATDSSRGIGEQRKALETLKRTYGEMLPTQDLTIEKLIEMREKGYEPLTAAIREYMAQMTLQNQINAINDTQGKIVEKYRKELEDEFKDGNMKINGRQLGVDQGRRIMKNIAHGIEVEGKSYRTAVKDAFRLEGFNVTDFGSWMERGHALRDYAESLAIMRRAIRGVTEEMRSSTGALGEYEDLWKAYKKAVDEYSPKDAQPNTYLFQRKVDNNSINNYAGFLRQIMGENFKDEWVDITNDITSEGQKTTTIFWDKIEEATKNAAPQLKTAIALVRAEYDKIVPPDKIIQMVNTKVRDIAKGSAEGMDFMKRYLMQGGDDIEKATKDVEDSLTQLRNALIRMRQANLMAAGTFSAEELKQTQEQIDLTERLLEFMKSLSVEKSEGGKGGAKSDTRLQTLNEIEQTLTKINQKYEELRKKEGDTKALEHIKEIYGDTLKYINKLGKKFNLGFDMPTDFQSLQSYRELILDTIKKLKKSGLKGADKAVLELQTKIGTGDLDQLQKQIEAKLKALADRISRTKTAKEFYDKILNQTGNMELAASVAITAFGTPGQDLNKQIREQIEQMVKDTSATIDPTIFRADNTFDPKKLREFAEANKALLGKDGKVYEELNKLAADAEKDFAKTIENWLKATEKAKTYTDKLLDLARTTQTELSRIETQKNNAQLELANLLEINDPTKEQKERIEALVSMIELYDELRERLVQKQAKEQTSLAYEAFKDSPMYVQMFDDLDNASTRMLKNMKARMTELKAEWKNLTPAQIKEMQSRLNEIDAQLAKRNPFSVLATSLKEYRKLTKGGEDGKGPKSKKAADKALADTTEAADKARQKYNDLIKEYGEGSEESVQEVIDAKNELDKAMANEEAAQKAVENWKKVKDTIGLSANELFQMLNWAGDIASAVADISEALGADEEDVQYWNDVASALGEVSGGIQDIVSSAMSGNVIGVVSSALTAIPKMFVGFVNLFNAGRIRKANKEIRKQADLLEQLEYTYSQLEKAAEKVFGAEYIANYNQQLKVLNAQAAAYQKQLEAEKSKGKKADKDKLKEYENAYRDTMDEIADMQGSLSEKFLGSDLTSAARDFAQAWLDAYKEVGRAGAETSNAMK